MNFIHEFYPEYKPFILDMVYTENIYSSVAFRANYLFDATRLLTNLTLCSEL
jgi:hypothetical protein